MDLSVVFPAYLEAENLRVLLPQVHHELSQLTDAFEIIVVDTCEPMDASGEVAQEHGARYINRQGGNTYGDAVRSGIAAANGKYILFMDADGSHPPSFVSKLYAERENDIVIASRYVRGGKTENAKMLILMSKLVNLGYALVLNIRIKDISNSFKLYRADLLKGLELSCDNFDVVEEIIVKILRQHPQTKVLEIPFTFKKRLHGETKRNLLQFVFTYIYTLIKLRFLSSPKSSESSQLQASQERQP